MLEDIMPRAGRKLKVYSNLAIANTRYTNLAFLHNFFTNIQHALSSQHTDKRIHREINIAASQAITLSVS